MYSDTTDPFLVIAIIGVAVGLFWFIFQLCIMVRLYRVLGIMRYACRFFMETNEQAKAAAIQMVNNGESITYISDRFGIPKARIQEWTEDILKQKVLNWKSQENHYTIAAQLGLPAATVKKWLDE